MRLVLWQTEPVLVDVKRALAALEGAAAEAAGLGADLLITPEMFLSGYAIGEAALQALAEPSDGPIWAKVGAIAKCHGIALLAGGPRRDEGGRIFNTAQLYGKSGDLLGYYDKTHLFGDVDRAQFQAGSALSEVIEFQGWSLGLAICYDIEFPEVARALAAKGADAILVPTANMEPFDSVATRLVPARGEENGVYVAYANYCGADDGFTYNGLSCLTGPDGADIARAGRTPAMIIGTLSKEDLARMRAAVTYMADRRTDLYPGNKRYG